MALQSTGSSADQIQSGSQSQRPPIPNPGQIRFNTNTQDLELYESGRWVSMRPPVDTPIRDSNRTIGLNFDKGLHIVGSNLEASLGDGLAFDNDGHIRVVPDQDISLSYKPIIASYTSMDLSVSTTGGPIVSDLPGTKRVTMSPPAESNAALCIAMVKMSLRCVDGGGKYPSSQMNEAYARGNWRAYFTGRNCYAYSAAAQERIGATVAMNVAFNSTSGGEGDRGPTSESWNLKFEELRWDKNKSEPIHFDFSWNDWIRNSSEIQYGAIRIAVMPYAIS